VCTTNRKTITMFVAAVAVLIGVGMIANPMQQVNAQGNQTKATNATNATEGVAKNATGGEKSSSSGKNRRRLREIKIFDE